MYGQKNMDGDYMKRYKVDCEIHIGDDYVVEAESEQEAEEIAYDMFVADYGLEDNMCILGFGVVRDVEEVDEDDD